MRVAPLALLLLAASGCDSTGIDRDEIEVRAQSVEFLAVVPSARPGGAEGRRVSFRYVGEVPRACEYRGGYGYSTGPDGPGRVLVEVRVDRFPASGGCREVTGQVEIVPLDVTVPGPGAYTFAFARPGDDPLEVAVGVD